MRITRSLLYVLSHATSRIVKKISLSISVGVLLVSGMLASQNILTTPSEVSAVIPHDSCFATSGTTTKMITAYYDNEDNDPAKPACPRAVDIPETIAGGTVVGIGTYGMSSKNITAVTFPSTITTLNQYALAYNQIETVTIPPNLTVINTGVFRANKLTSVVFHDGVTSIGDRAFVDNDLPTINIPPNVTYIGPRALWGNEFEEVTIPASVTTIASEALAQNYALKTVIVEGDPATIGTNVLSNTIVRKVVYNGTVFEPQTTNIALAESCVRFSVASQSITGYSMYYNLTDVKNGINCLSSDITIPGSIGGVPVLTLGASSFWGRELAAVTIPEGVVTIGSNAFYGNAIREVVIPASVQTISDYAFYRNELSELTIPGDTTTIGRGAFLENKLASVTLPTNLQVLSSFSFMGNYLSKLTIPSSVTTIEEYAFAANKITQVSIPASVNFIDSAAFFGQNPNGRDIDTYSSSEGWYSSDPAALLAAYDSIWYARLLLEDPENPHGLQSGYVSEDTYLSTDINSDGDLDDSLGGHIIQAVPFTTRYLDKNGKELLPATLATGVVDGVVVSDYLVKNGPELPPPADYWNPTPEELAAVDAMFSASYYQFGDEITWAAPIIDGYVKMSPTSGTFVLGVSTASTLDLRYITQAEYDAHGAPSSRLSDTGMNTGLLIVLSSGIMAAAGAVITTQRRKKVGFKR